MKASLLKIPSAEKNPIAPLARKPVTDNSHTDEFMNQNLVYRMQQLHGNQFVQRVLAASSANNVVRRMVGLPNPQEERLIGNALTVLRDVKTTANAGNRQAIRAFKRRLTAFDFAFSESLNLANAGTAIGTHINANAGPANATTWSYISQNVFNQGVQFGQVPQIGPHLSPLVSEMNDILDRTAVPGSGIGTQLNAAAAQCLGVNIAPNMTFTQLDGAARGTAGFANFSNEEVGSYGQRSRFLWRFQDRSQLVIDVPGQGVKENYAVSIRPHIHLMDPGGEHLSSDGTIVPAFSHPAHILFDYNHNSLKSHIRANGGTWPYV